MTNSLESRLIRYSAFIRDGEQKSSMDRYFSRLQKAYATQDFKQASSVAVKLLDMYRWENVDIQLIFYTVVTGILSDTKLVDEEKNYITRCLSILHDYIPGDKVSMNYHAITEFGIEGVYQNLVIDTIDLSMKNHEYALAAGYSASLTHLFSSDEDFVGSTGLLFALAGDYQTAFHYLSQCTRKSYRFFFDAFLNDSVLPIDFVDNAQHILSKKISPIDKEQMSIIYDALVEQL